MLKYLVALWCLLAAFNLSKAQSLLPGGAKQLPQFGISKFYHSPSSATYRSLLVPGAGQLYNGKWWKLPIIYGGFAFAGSIISFNQRYYTEFKKLYKYKTGRTPLPKPADKYYGDYQKLKDAPDALFENSLNMHRRNRDLAVLGLLGVWGLQAIDAYIDAKFIQSYSVDEDLSFNIRPGLLQQPAYASNGLPLVPSLMVSMRF